MVFHLVFCWPHRERLSVGNISVSLRFFKWSTGKPGNEISRVQVKFPPALSFPRACTRKKLVLPVYSELNRGIVNRGLNLL